MIELKKISRVYRPKKSEAVFALNKVDLVLEKTGMVFILGKSGSGKSTFLNVVGGLDKYTEGDLIIKNKSTQDFKQSDFDSYRNTMIGFIFQEYNLLDEFTVAQNIGLALELQGKKATSEKISQILEDVDLAGYGKRKPNELSVGQKQRVAIARALVKDPEIIMADEPTGALDSATGKQVLETLEKLSATRLVIVVSHDREFAENYASRIIEFKDGYIINDVTRAKSVKKETKNILLSDKGIQIKEGYVLTREDTKLINEYLQSRKEATSLIKLQEKGSFGSTDLNALTKGNEAYHSIKSKLPFKSSLKIGASSLKHKTVRLVFAIILAAIAFAMFGLADTLSSYDEATATVNSIIDSKIDYVNLSKQKLQKSDDWEDYYTVRISLDDIDYLNREYPDLNFKPIYTEVYLSYSSFLYDPIEDNEMFYYKNPFAGLSELESSELVNFDIDLLGNSRLPSSDDEVVITKFVYEVFKKFSYKDGTGSKVAITTYNDLIGKQLNLGMDEAVTIVGIIDTKFDSSRFEKIKNYTGFEDLSDMMLVDEFNTVLNHSNHNLLYVNKGYIEREALRYGSYISYGDTDLYFEIDGYYIFTDYVNKRSFYDLSELTLFKNVDFANLHEKDVIISTSYLFSIRTDLNATYEAALDAHILAYVNTLSLEQIEQGLKTHPLYAQDYEDIPSYDTWDDDLKNEYREEFVEVYFNENFITNIFGKSYNDLAKEVLSTFFDDVLSFEADLNLSEVLKSSSTIPENIRIVGVVDDEKIAREKMRLLIFEDEYLESLGVYDDGIYDSVISFINLTKHNVIKKLVDNHYGDGDFKYSYNNEITYTLRFINFLIEILASVFIYVGIVFAIFSSLLLLNYITTSVAYKKKEIGILRAIGARGVDVLGIFAKEALIISLINFVIATILSTLTISLINYEFRYAYGFKITILNFGIRQIFLMLVISIFVGLVSSALPVLKIARKRPIDAIRDN